MQPVPGHPTNDGAGSRGDSVMQRVHGRIWMLGAVLLALSITAFTLGTGIRSVHAQSANAVSIVDFAFQPASIEVPAGSTVTWTNTGAVTHTVTADDGAYDSGQLKPGTSFSQTFTTPGTYTYHCEIHPQMTGTVVVTEAAASAAPAAPAAPTASTHFYFNDTAATET